MKNKATVYVLVTAVALVWGLIIYRVYSAISAGGDDTPPVSSVNSAKESFNDYSLPKDTAKLQLNYRDPFGLTIQKDTVRVAKEHIVNQIKKLPQPQFNWDFIKYSGYLKNPTSKKLIAFLTVNGKDVALAEGETIDNVRLLKNLHDSVKVSFNGKIKYIPLHAKTL